MTFSKPKNQEPRANEASPRVTSIQKKTKTLQISTKKSKNDIFSKPSFDTTLMDGKRAQVGTELGVKNRSQLEESEKKNKIIFQ